MSTVFRKDGWVKSVLGPAIPGAQVYVCFPQPANTSALPPSPLATIYSDPMGLVPIDQPIITDGFGHYDYYAVSGLYTEVIGLNNTVQQVYPDQTIGLVGTANPPGNDTGLVAGSGITITGSTISASGSTPLQLQTDGVDNTLQTLLNLKSGTNITLTADGSGGVTIDAASSGASIQTITRVFTPTELRAAVDILLIPGVVGKRTFIFGGITIMGANTVLWSGGTINIYSGHGDLFWAGFNDNTEVESAVQISSSGLAGASSGGPPDILGEDVYAVINAFAPVNADGSITLILLYTQV